LIDEFKSVYRCLTFSTDGVIRRKVRVVYNSIDLRPFETLDMQRDIRDIVGIPEDAIVVGTISRLDEPKKGLAVLLHSAKSVMDRLQKVRLVICGDGYSRSILEKLAKELCIDDRVFFLGYWENALEVYRMLDIFVLPSFSEGFPTVNLEAMAAGLPVITTDVGGAAEAVKDGDCGYVVPPRDANALAEAILRLSDDVSLRSAMGSRAKSIVCERFASDKMAQGILEIYGEAFGRRTNEAL
jgi:glycosyltransferase involved in cell wall biosynthesis